mmetsp:Transcript_8381/g.14999  ORF Transcript_8381/g.14999 Transcript_8381/m.14999 type:complete len:110 (-) Transcript_8381:8-337(-)
MTNTANMLTAIKRAVTVPTCGWKAPERKIMSSGREITQAIPLTMKSRKEGHQALCWPPPACLAVPPWAEPALPDPGLPLFTFLIDISTARGKRYSLPTVQSYSPRCTGP